MCKNVRNSNDKGEKALNNNEINSDNHTLTIRPIGHIASHFQSKFGTPRQSGLVPDSVSRIIFEKEYQNEDYFRGITDFSYLRYTNKYVMGSYITHQYGIQRK